MTETPTSDPPRQHAPAENIALHPSDLLMHVIAAFLAPMFITASGGDICFARLAAIETVSAYRSRGHADLVAIAQIVAYGLAALGSLSLSMADDISLSMTLRLRGNANALNRSAEHNRRTLRDSHGAAAQAQFGPDPAQDQYEAELFANLAETRRLLAGDHATTRVSSPAATPEPPASPEPVIAAPEPAATQPPITQPAATQPATQPAASQPIAVAPPAATTQPAASPRRAGDPTPSGADQRRIQSMWAAAMTDVAGEFAAGMAQLPPAKRWEASRRVAALSSCASQLLLDPTPPRKPQPGGLVSPIPPRSL